MSTWSDYLRRKRAERNAAWQAEQTAKKVAEEVGNKIAIKRTDDGHLDLENVRITNVASPTHPNDVANKDFVVKHVTQETADCLKLSKSKYDVGGRRIVGLVDCLTDDEAARKAYVDTRLASRVTKNELNSQLDDYATTKYVDDSIAASNQKEEGAKPPKFDPKDLEKTFVKKTVLDIYLKDLKKLIGENEDDLSDLLAQDLVTEPELLAATQKSYFVCSGHHNNEDEVEFHTINEKVGNWGISNDKKKLTFKEAGIWEITLIDNTKETTKGNKVEMVFSNPDMRLYENRFVQKVEKSSDWVGFYMSRIVPLQINSTLNIRFLSKNESVLDGQIDCKLIIKKYL